MVVSLDKKPYPHFFKQKLAVIEGWERGSVDIKKMESTLYVAASNRRSTLDMRELKIL